MKLSEEMKNKTLLSFELFPPKTEKGLQNLPGTIAVSYTHLTLPTTPYV